MNICLDVETTKFPKALPWIEGSYLVSIHMATSEGEVRSWLFNHPEATQSQREIIQEVQSYVDRSSRIIAHNLKFDLHWLIHSGLSFPIKMYCTLMGEYILRCFDRSDSLSLSDLSKHYGIPEKIDKVKLFWDSDYETDEIPAKILIPYGEQDCINTLSIYNKQVPQIIASNKQKYVSLEMEVIRDLQEAEYNGMLLDTQLLAQFHTDYCTKIDKYDKEMLGLLGEEINLSSGQQLSGALYDNLGITPLPDTETKKCGVYKTDAETISQLKATSKKAKKFLELYRERAKVSTLNKTFFSGLLKRVLPDSKVHPTINQTITRTSRLSCSNPNLQNLPRGSTGPVKQTVKTRYV